VEFFIAPLVATSLLMPCSPGNFVARRTASLIKSVLWIAESS